ncbi:MAG: S8 family serine peptidase [Archaeoglobaceae archaeon]
MNPLRLCILFAFVLAIFTVEAIAESPQKTPVGFEKIGIPIHRDFLSDKLSKLQKTDLHMLKEKNADKIGTLSEKVREKKIVKLPTGEKVEVGITDKAEIFVLSADENVKVMERLAIPRDVDLRKVDEKLFNVEALIKEGYADSERIPVIVVAEKEKMGNVEGVAKSLGKAKKFEIIPAISLEVKKGDDFRKLLSIDGVKKVWLDRKVRALLSESVPLINASEVWNLGYNGSGVKIAILDTGINSSHGDFYFEDGTPKIIYSVDLTDDGTAEDLNGHGTHVASIAAGTGNETEFKGVAPGAYLMNVKVLNQSGWGYNSWIIQGIEHAVGNGTDIISMSLGGIPTSGEDPLSLACDAAVENGVIVVAAAGNYGDYYTISSPGSAKKVITVGATDKTDQIASFSSRGPTLDYRVKPEVVAPGVDIEAANYQGGTAVMSGTSMATPHVSGLAALLKQARNVDPETVKNIIASTSVLLDYDVFTQGAGRINALAAINTELIAEPAVVSLGVANQKNFTISFRNLNSSEDIPISIIANSNCKVWLNRTELLIQANSKAEVEVGVTAEDQGFCSGIIVTNYTVNGSDVHAVFGMVVPVSEEIDSCREISHPGYYGLNQSISGLLSDKDFCIGIFANDVVLDGQGFSIAGTYEGIGILVQANNVTVTNVSVSGYWAGIRLEDSSNSIIANNTISNNWVGICLLWASSDNIIENNTILNNYWAGIGLEESSNNVIENNTISNNGAGIYLWASSDNIIANNTISNNDEAGVYLWPFSTNNTVENNIILNNGAGIFLSESSNNTIADNIILNNWAGIFPLSSNNIIYNNLFRNTNNIYLYYGYRPQNTWNTTLQEGKNILGGNWLGGNAWLNPDGTGYSQTCEDSEEPIGICDEPCVIIDEYNIDYLPLSLVVAPDLTVSEIKVLVGEEEVSEITLGETARINATIENIGNADAQNFNVRFLVLKDNTEVLNQTEEVQGLENSKSIELSVEWTPSSAGSYTIRVIADSENEITESNEANNESSVTVKVVAPPTPEPTPTPTPEPTPPKTTPRPILGGGGGGGGGGGVIPGVPIYISDWIRLRANNSTDFTMPQSAFWETNVVALILLSDENVNAKLRIEKKKELPSDIPAPSGVVALILSIDPTLSTKANLSGRIQFGIPIEEIKAKGFDPNLVAVVLLKWNGKEWIELPTKFIGSDGKYNYYEATTESFSLFAAVLKPLETPIQTTPVTPTTPPTIVVTTPTTTPAEKPFIPGFEAIFAIAGLLAVSYLIRRKN